MISGYTYSYIGFASFGVIWNESLISNYTCLKSKPKLKNTNLILIQISEKNELTNDQNWKAWNARSRVAIYNKWLSSFERSGFRLKLHLLKKRGFNEIILFSFRRGTLRRPVFY